MYPLDLRFDVLQGTLDEADGRLKVPTGSSWAWRLIPL